MYILCIELNSDSVLSVVSSGFQYTGAEFRFLAVPTILCFLTATRGQSKYSVIFQHSMLLKNDMYTYILSFASLFQIQSHLFSHKIGTCILEILKLTVQSGGTSLYLAYLHILPTWLTTNSTDTCNHAVFNYVNINYIIILQYNKHFFWNEPSYNRRALATACGALVYKCRQYCTHNSSLPIIIVLSQIKLLNLKV